QRHHEVGLVVPGRRDDHVTSGHVGLLEAADLAGVGEHPLGLGDAFRAQLTRLALDQHDLVPVADQLLCDRPADVAGPGDGDPHGQCPPWTAAEALPTTALTVSSVTSPNPWSPSCTTVDAVAREPMPKRIR